MYPNFWRKKCSLDPKVFFEPRIRLKFTMPMKTNQKNLILLVMLLAMCLLGNRSMAQFWAVMPAPNTNWGPMACSADGLKIAATVGGPYANGPIYTSSNGGTNWTVTSAPMLNWIAIAS